METDGVDPLLAGESGVKCQIECNYVSFCSGAVLYLSHGLVSSDWRRNNGMSCVSLALMNGDKWKSGGSGGKTTYGVTRMGKTPEKDHLTSSYAIMSLNILTIRLKYYGSLQEC